MIEKMVPPVRLERTTPRSTKWRFFNNFNSVLLIGGRNSAIKAASERAGNAAPMPNHSGSQEDRVMAEKALPSIADLRQRLKCDPETGEIWRLVRGKWAPAFTASDNYGYKVGICFRKQRKAHRVIWALHYGEWPAGEIDHVDGDRANNRIQNLRLATRSGQLQNVGIRSTNTSGYAGVSWHQGRQRWRAAIRCQGAARHLGYFDCPAKAGAAYLDAKERLHTFNPTLRGQCK